jgi:hypothetical protein
VHPWRLCWHHWRTKKQRIGSTLSLTAARLRPRPPPSNPQNHLGDLHGLLAFLRLDPLQQRQLFTRVLGRPIKQRDPRGFKSLQVGWGGGGVQGGQCVCGGGLQGPQPDLRQAKHLLPTDRHVIPPPHPLLAPLQVLMGAIALRRTKDMQVGRARQAGLLG